MTSVLISKRWVEFIYHIHTPRPRRCQPKPVQVIRNRDGSVTSRWGTSDCTQIVSTVFPDRGYIQQFRYSDGLRERLVAVPGDFLHPPDITPQEFTFADRLSSGARADYVLRLDLQELFPGSVLTRAEHYKGTFTLGHEVFHFSLDRTINSDEPTLDVFQTRLPGGISIRLLVPYDLENDTADFSQPMRGVLSDRHGTLPFQLVSHDAGELSPHWDTLAVQERPASGRLARHGTFSIGRDFSGHGQLYRGSRLFFVAAWNEDAQANVILPTGQTTSAGPARGALDLLALRWSGLASANGPQPGL